MCWISRRSLSLIKNVCDCLTFALCCQQLRRSSGDLHSQTRLRLVRRTGALDEVTLGAGGTAVDVI